MKRFGDIVEEVRRKPYDLLDAAKNIFDRDFLEFNVHINDLELAVQARTCPSWKYLGLVCILMILSAIRVGPKKACTSGNVTKHS